MVALCAAAALSWSWSFPVPAAPALAAGKSVPLAPHRAVYDVALAESSAGEGIAAIEGRMVFEFTGSACSGYTLNIRLVTGMTDQSGDTTVTDLRSSTREHGEGKKFRFNSAEYHNDTLVESTRGTATRQSGGKGIVVDLSKPEENRISYSGDILFPTRHTLAILSAAREGRRIVQAKVFDGSERGERLYATTAFIGERKPPGSGEQTQAGGGKLAELASWPVTVSYFDAEAPDKSTPAYEMSFRLYANGISRDVMIDYGEFAIRGALESLEFLSPPACE